MSCLKVASILVIFSLVSCDVDIQADHFIYKRASTNVKCVGGSFTLCEGKDPSAKPTPNTIEEEAMAKKSSKLYKEYMTMIQFPDYKTLLSTGEVLGLSKDETQAVRLYTMGNEETGVFKELNTALREGRDIYPVLHFRFQSALSKLPKIDSFLYRGYRKIVNVKNGTTLHLPGYTSTSYTSYVAQSFSSPGCTLMQFDASKQGALVRNLSQYPHENEVVIPPTEEFNVYKKTFLSGYRMIYLRPSRVGKRSTSVFTLCSSCDLNTLSPFLLVVIVTFGFFAE